MCIRFDLGLPTLCVFIGASLCLGGSLTGAGTLDATANAKRWSLWLAAAPPVVSRENRLIWVVPASPSNDPPRNKKVKFVYDYMGRRVQKAIYMYNIYGQNWPQSPDEVQRFVYDGWNVVMVLNDDNETFRTLTWGLDLSGSIHGASGIGGLLSAVEVHDPESSTDDERFWYFYDANGNVGQVLNATSTANITLAAHYEYAPYGNVIASSGAYAATNPFRFSTKWYDVETDMYYYGLRYYLPRYGRWGSRDPIGEEGGHNLCAFVQNSPTYYLDALGRNPLYQQGALDRINARMWPQPGFPLTSFMNMFYYPSYAMNCGCECEEAAIFQIVKFKKSVSGWPDTDTGWRADDPAGWYPDSEWHPECPPGKHSWGSMADAPGQYGLLGGSYGSEWRIEYLYQTFESCVVCTKGAQIRRVYGCLKWGHEWKQVVQGKSVFNVTRWIENNMAQGVEGSKAWPGAVTATVASKDYVPQRPSAVFMDILMRAALY